MTACPLSGVKRTQLIAALMSAFDSKQICNRAAEYAQQLIEGSGVSCFPLFSLLSGRFGTSCLTQARRLSAMVFPHSVRGKNIAKQGPTNHPRDRYPIWQFHQHLCCKRGKHRGKPGKCNRERFAPTKIGRDIGPIGAQVLDKIPHLFSLTRNASP